MSSPFREPAGPIAAAAFCPSCGAGRAADRTSCWLCLAPYDGTPPPRAAIAPDSRLAAANPSQFSIATILLVTTLAAVCLGVFRLAPGLGIVLMIFAVPALVRTVFVGRGEHRHGRRLSTGRKIGHFFLSLAIMYAVWTAASMAFAVAFMGTCLAALAVSNASSSSGEAILIGGLILGSVVGLAVASVILWATWPKVK